MSFKTLLKDWIDRVNVIDVLVAAAGLLLCCVASPYVVRQFEHLKLASDKFWNICWDAFIFDVGLIALLILSAALKALLAWLKKQY